MSEKVAVRLRVTPRRTIAIDFDRIKWADPVLFRLRLDDADIGQPAYQDCPERLAFL